MPAPVVRPAAPLASAPIDYASAKAQYKQARRAVGKSHKPLIIALVVLMVLIAVASSFLTWSFANGEDLPLPLGGASEKVAAHQSDQENLGTAGERAEEKNGGYVGTWKGMCSDTASQTSSKKCYGGETSDMMLTVKKVTATERVEADITVVYHGHAFNGASQTAATSTSGDVVETLTNVTGTFSDGTFSFVGEIDGSEESLKIDVAPERTSSDSLVATVTSVYDGRSVVKDTYDLVKTSD